MSTVDNPPEVCHEEDDAYLTVLQAQTPTISLASRDECYALFSFLKTPDGEEFLQGCYETLQEYKRRKQLRRRRTRQSRVSKLVDARKYEEWEEQKFEIFYYYMQNFSADGIERAMKAAGHVFSTPSSRTFINRLENWGFTLNPRFRRILIKSLRERVAWEQPPCRFYDDEIFGSSSLPGSIKYSPTTSLNSDHVDTNFGHNLIAQSTKSLGASFNCPDSPTLGSLPINILVPGDINRPETRSALSSVHQDLNWLSFHYPQLNSDEFDVPEAEELQYQRSPVPTSSLPDLLDQWNRPNPELDRMMALDDDTPGTILHEMIDQIQGNPEGSCDRFSPANADVDSAYNSMEVCEVIGCQQPIRGEEARNHPKFLVLEPEIGGSIGPILQLPETARNDSSSSNVFATAEVAQISPSDSAKLPIDSSILHRIPCQNDHAGLVFGLSGVCDCGVSKVHAICMLMTNLQDDVVLSFLSNIRNINELDGAGNTVLHYAATSGRRRILEYMMKSGVDLHRRNSLGQNFLHVLDSTCFGSQLIEFLSNIREYGLLDQRDYTGRTVLHGLLHYPIERGVCHQLIDFYGSDGTHQFALRDNQGRDASEYLKNRFPYSFYNHPNYVQTIMLFEDLAESFVVRSPDPNNILPRATNGECINRRAIIQRVNGRQEISSANCEDCTGSNALHCLAYFPEGRHPSDEKSRLNQLQQAITRGVDLNSYDRDGRTPLLAHLQALGIDEDDSEVELIVSLLVENGANIHTRDRDGHTAIYYAVVKGFSNCVSTLLQHGAHVNCVAKDGRSLRRIAQESLQDHFHVSDKLQQRLAIFSALAPYKAELEPTILQQWGIH